MPAIVPRRRGPAPATGDVPSRAALALAAGLLLAGCAPRGPAATPAPDTGKRAVASHGMIASAHPLASEAGLRMLRQGGNAVDAAVATAFAIGVVEPMMSGLGAGGGILIWPAATRHPVYVNFYSTAPSAPVRPVRGEAGPADAKGAAIPGGVAGLLLAQQKYGRLPRAAVLEPAIRLARDGFPVHSLLARVVAEDSAKLSAYEGARRIFLPDGHPIHAGQTLVQPELAATLERIAAGGADAFYRGPVAADIVHVLNDGGNPTTVADFAAFHARPRRPLCGTYEGRVVLSAPPPQSGMQVIEMLHLLEAQHLPALGLPTRSPEAFRRLVGAMRVGIVNRNAFVGDPDHAAVPAAGIASGRFAASRAAALRSADDGALPALSPGDPWAEDSVAATGACAALQPFGPARAAPRATPTTGNPGDDGLGETTHMSVVDADGDAVALTYTNGLYFGSGVWVDGFFLNSGMWNFSRSDSSANAFGPGRVPASTISPTIILRDGRVEMVVGSPGSAAIPPAVVETILYTLDYGLDPLEALRMPRVLPTAGPAVRVEDGFAAGVLADAARRGYRLIPTPPTDMVFGGVHVIARRGNRWVGAADPRRDGEVRGY